MKKLLVSVIALFGAVSLSAQDVTAIYNEAAAAFGAKNFTEAATKFEQVIDQGMDNESAASMVATAKSTLPKCYFMLGGGALKTKNYDEALKNFEKSAELAELYGDMNQMAKSNGWVAKIYQIQGGDAFNNKDYATASEIFAKGYAADPDNTGMALNLAMSYCEMAMSSGDMSQYEKGMEIYEAVAAKTHPKYAEDAAKAKEDMALYTNNMVAKMQAANDFDGIIKMADDLLADADTAGRLDFLIQKALFAHRFGGVRPELTDTALELTDMINPELCDLLQEQGRAFVPVSISLDRGAAVITGANMGGKSVAMKTVALNVLLLQAGFLVCAKSARMPLFWSVHMLFDDLQSIQSGLSGFGSEIVQFQKALAEVEQGYSLFLLDEFARGTNPDEGAIIVQAVTRYLNDVNAISLLTTHYDKVAEHARVHYQIIGLRDVDPEQIRRELAATNEDGVAGIARHMNYGLYRVEGRSDCPRDALNICRMLSLKPEILEKIEQSY